MNLPAYKARHPAKAASPARTLVVAAAAGAGLLLGGCLKVLKPDVVGLTSAATTPASAPNCSGCHAYPLHDVNHYYHLLAINPMSLTAGEFKLNGRITCMDCHFESVAHFTFPFPETTWVDKDGFELPFKANPGDTIARITPHTRYHPVPADLQGGPLTGAQVDTLMSEAARIGAVVSWLTGRKHMNGLADVAFPPNNLKGPDTSTRGYRPRDLSCSAIACHSAPEVSYRWASKIRGLGGCPTFAGTDTSCGEKPE